MEENTRLGKHERRVDSHKGSNTQTSVQKSKKSSKKIIVFSIIFIIFAGIVYASVSYYTKPGEYDEFAKCLTDKGYKMYGVDWCPNCRNQKKMFGKSFKYVDYIECTKQKEACSQAQIEGYPTWIVDTETYVGVQSLARLSSISECQLSSNE